MKQSHFKISFLLALAAAVVVTGLGILWWQSGDAHFAGYSNAVWLFFLLLAVIFYFAVFGLIALIFLLMNRQTESQLPFRESVLSAIGLTVILVAVNLLAGTFSGYSWYTVVPAILIGFLAIFGFAITVKYLTEKMRASRK